MKYNEKYEEIFSEQDKIKAFDKIAELFYDRNFSSTSKSEVELLMFSVYMDAMINQNQNSDGVLDYNKCSDYNMSRVLGISPERVKNLKLKKQVRYPQPFNWRKSLEDIKDGIRYDEKKQKIIIPIKDINLYNEIKNFIEEKGGYIDIQKSSNYIQIRPEYYFMLVFEDSSEEDKKNIKKEFEKELNKRNKNNQFNIEKSNLEMIKDIVSTTNDSLEFISNILSIVTPSNPLVHVLKALIKIVK